MPDVIFYTFDGFGNYTGAHQHVSGAPVPPRKTTVPPPSAGPEEYLVWMGGAWDRRSEPARASLDERKTQLRDALAHRRWEAETAGISVGGGEIATDRESQAMITGAFTRAQDKLAQGQTEDTIRFKGMSGWVELDIPTTMAIGRAVGDHVQACFDREYDLDTQIEAAEDDAALDAIDIETGWPGQ